jgi:Flp pilus assembly secretin CpaC
MRRILTWSTIAAATTLALVAAPSVVLIAGQDNGTSRQAGAAPAGAVPLKIEFVISRYEGDKKISSLPFSLWVSTGGGTNIRMGSEVPIPTSLDGKSGVTYRSVGTFIDCKAWEIPGAKFNVDVQVQDSSLYTPGREQNSQIGQTVSGFPVIRSFSASNHLTLRDGQNAEFVMATDKVSGEVLKVNVTLTTVK